MEKDISIPSDPRDGFQSVRGHFWVVFRGQYNGEVTVHISWHGKIHLHNFWSSGEISMFQGSFWCSISSLIKCLGCCIHQLTWEKTWLGNCMRMNSYSKKWDSDMWRLILEYFFEVNKFFSWTYQLTWTGHHCYLGSCGCISSC